MLLDLFRFTRSYRRLTPHEGVQPTRKTSPGEPFDSPGDVPKAF